MPTTHLLDINPDKLFEDSSIAEVENIQKKLQNEIDRKREELRTMVGERYRDLIEAADTISLMKKISENVIDDVNKMQRSTAELQEKHMLGFKIAHQPKDIKNNLQAVVAAQIKILVDISEYIWEAVDRSDFTQATSLYLMARVIRTSLGMNPNLRTAKYFPVVSRQWTSIAQFKDTILKGAEENLRTQHDSQVSSSGLVSLALLQGLTSAQLLDCYLSLRSDALRSALSIQKAVDSDIIKHRLCHSYKLLIHSIMVVSHCFLEHIQEKGGLLWQELQCHVGPQSQPTLQYFDKETRDILTPLLPFAVTNFRPEVDPPLQELPEQQVLEAISSWLVWVRAYVKDQGGQLLQRLSSLRSLQGLRDPPTDISEEWPLIAQKLQLISNVDLWNELYRSLITVRAQQLVSVHWNAAFKALQQQIRSTFESACVESKQSEIDLQWYMWKESESDLNNLSGLKCSRGLWLKSKGITPRVSELCVMLENKVCSLLGDLACLCPDQDVDPALLTISQTLKTHQQTVCSNLIVRLVDFVKELLNETSCEAGALLLAKFLQSVPELCPSLSRCLSSVDNKTASSLNVECQVAYKVWLSLVSGRLLEQISDCLTSTVPHLQSLPQWEEINIEEEGEAGEKVQSTLKVPYNPSLHLQASLQHLNVMIGRVAIPKQICEQLIEIALKCIIEMYNKNIEQNLTQTQYLQMLLDVRYLAQLFDISNNKDLKNVFQDTISKLESKVDPFDLNVFTPYINDNFKTNSSRTQTLLGAGMAAPGVGMTPSNHGSGEPSILALSSAASSGFPLLHITAPKSIQAPIKLKGKKLSSSTTVANTSSESGAKQSSASSFFGAMATDWFG